MNQTHRIFFPLDNNVITILRRKINLTIAGALCVRPVGFAYNNFNFAVGIHHNRAMAHGVRANWYQYKSIKFGVQNRAATRKGIGGRTCWCGDD